MRPFTVRVNCQIRGLTSIRKRLRKDDTLFLVSSDSIIASENVSGRVSGENLKNSREAIFTNPEGSPILRIRSGPNFANPEGSNFANPEGSYCCQSVGVPILPSRRVLFLTIQRGPFFTNPEGSHFANPEGSCFCQLGRLLFFSIRKGIVLSRLKKTTEKKVVQGIRLLRDRLGTSDCTGNLPLIKNQTKTKQV